METVEIAVRHCISDDDVDVAVMKVEGRGIMGKYR